MSETAPGYDFRFGIDLGGTKIEIAALSRAGELVHRTRVSTPPIYQEAVRAIVELVRGAESALGGRGSVGVGIPGVISPATGLVKNANSQGLSETEGLNGHPLNRDLAEALQRPVRVENDANCFALSEASDGAGAGAAVVFGVIIGTGTGAGIIINGQVIAGPHRIAGEFGHIPLPWPTPEESPGPHCWCGQYGCVERWTSGTALAMDCDGPDARDAHSVVVRAAAGEVKAQAALKRHTDRLARGLAVIVNVLDPDVIVLGGGLSNMEHLYYEVPPIMYARVFSDVVATPVVKNKHGDSSGVRGAAWLWPVT